MPSGVPADLGAGASLGDLSVGDAGLVALRFAGFLDVYKRPDVLNPSILYIELQADVGNLVIPVSYTHLDVYKRQAMV